MRRNPPGGGFFGPDVVARSLQTPEGMRVARASSGPKIPRRKRGRIYETGYYAAVEWLNGARLCAEHQPQPPRLSGHVGWIARAPSLAPPLRLGLRSEPRS